MEIETLQSGGLMKNHNNILDNMENEEDDWEGGDNSAKLFERSRIRALAGRNALMDASHLVVFVLVNL